MCRCGTSGHGLVGMAVLGGRLDFMILEVFSNLNDSMILWFFNCFSFPYLYGWLPKYLFQTWGLRREEEAGTPEFWYFGPVQIINLRFWTYLSGLLLLYPESCSHPSDMGVSLLLHWVSCILHSFCVKGHWRWCSTHYTGPMVTKGNICWVFINQTSIYESFGDWNSLLAWLEILISPGSVCLVRTRTEE